MRRRRSQIGRSSIGFSRVLHPTIVLVLLCLFSAGETSYSEVFVYDGFSRKHYVEGQLNNQNGGFGHAPWDGYPDGEWGGEWVARVEPAPEKGLCTELVGGVGGSAYGRASVYLYPSLGSISTNGEPIYLSFLIDSMWKTNKELHYVFFEVIKHYYPPDAWPVPAPPFLETISQFYAGDYQGSNWVWLGELYFHPSTIHLVMELAFGTNGQYRLRWFANPPRERALAVPLTEASGTNSTFVTPYTRLEVFFCEPPNSEAFCKFRFDEIRLVNSWDDLFRPLYGDVIVNVSGEGSAVPNLLEMVPVGTVTNITFEATNGDHHISLIRIGNQVVYSNASSRGITSTNLVITVTNNVTIEADFAESRTVNGIPLRWLTAYGISNKADAVEAEDPDGDGLTNLQEWIAETDPTNPLSRFPNLLVEQRDRPVLIMEPVSTQRLLQIERKTNLYQTSWLLWTSVVPPSAHAEFPIPTMDTPEMFFRAKVRLQE